MKRREFTRAAVAAWLPLAAGGQAAAQSLLLTEADAVAGLRAALQQGVQAAVSTLGRADGFLANPQVRIPLPPRLEQAQGLLRTLGQGPRLDDLRTAMNRAAEAAVPQARDLLVNAVRTMTVSDARDILQGGDTSATRYFAGRTRVPLGERFLPIVTQATGRLSLARRYNALLGKAAGLGLIAPEQEVTLEQHVTAKALDGLFHMIGEEERRLRQHPATAGSALLRRVFGSLR